MALVTIFEKQNAHTAGEVTEGNLESEAISVVKSKPCVRDSKC